jgi:hypothetical protein
MKKKILTLCSVSIALFLSLACGWTTSGEKVGGTASPTDALEKAAIYKIGDVIKVEDYTITLNSASVIGGKLTSNFTFDNTTGKNKQTISSLVEFYATDSEGKKLNYSLCGSSQIDNDLLPGSKLTGDVCWGGAASSAKYKIYFKTSMFGSGAVIWDVQ